MRVLLFNRSLNTGGAERQLVLLAKSLHERGISVAVMVYYGGGAFRSELENAGVTVIDLKKKGRWDIFWFALRTIMAIRKYKPDVIYTFIGAHLVASALWGLIGRPAIVWGVRASNMDLGYYDWMSRFGEFCSIRMSRFADFIICNSEAGRMHIQRLGYASHSITVIPNGIDTDRFKPNPSVRAGRRKSWNIPVDSLVIGMMARIDHMKDHSRFLMAASKVYSDVSNVYFVCVGSGSASLHSDLKQQSSDCGLGDAVRWIGHSDNPVYDYSAIDIFVQPSSFGEGFPNAVGEAMACGLPVVASDVGDCRRIVGEYGWIVPAKNHEALADAILNAISALPNWIPGRSRERIMENFSVDAMVNRTLNALQSVFKK